MQWLSRTTRLAALLVPIIAVGVVVAVFFDGAFSSSEQALAGGPNLTGVYCLDIYVDDDPDDNRPKGFPPTINDNRTSKTILRIEDSQKQVGGWDVTTQNYISSEIPLTCQEEYADGVAGPEANVLGPNDKFAAVSEKRPEVTAKVTTKDITSGPANAVLIAGPDGTTGETTWEIIPKTVIPFDRVVVEVAHDGASPKVLMGAGSFFTCTSPAQDPVPAMQKSKGPNPLSQPNATPTVPTGTLEVWSTSENFPLKCIAATVTLTPAVSTNVLVIQAVELQNSTGQTVTNLEWSTCDFSEASKLFFRTDYNIVLSGTGPDEKSFGSGTFAINAEGPDCVTGPLTFEAPLIFVLNGRTPTTDHPNEAKNDPLIKGGTLAVDGDGPEKEKFVPQDADGTTENPFVADDWDGDGCPDWDELDKDFINGRDPFNPTDCNVDDYTGTYNILATAFPASKQGLITGTLANVLGEVSKEIKDGTHISVTLEVDDPNALSNNQKVYWEQWVYDPTNLEDGVNTCGDGKENGTDSAIDEADSDCLDDAKQYAPAQAEDGVIGTCADTQENAEAGEEDGVDDADPDCYDLTDQAGWWQVETGSIGPKATPAATPASKVVTLNRLVVPPCGLVTLGLPSEPAEVPATPDQLLSVQCAGNMQQGNYFHCIARLDHNTGDNSLDGNVVCYIDAPLISAAGPQSALPSFADGNAGPPPPPPYGMGASGLFKLNGTLDKDNQRIIVDGCLGNIGGALGPNVLVHLNIDAHSLQGFTDVWFVRSNAECTAKTPNVGVDPSLQLETVLARQEIDFDHDEDGCSDYDELGNVDVDPPKDPPTTQKLCGDDPYNPFDSDANFTANTTILVTVQPADVEKDASESGSDCLNDTSDDLDVVWVNDGCPAANDSTAESGTECENDIDDDKDGKVNDGCPAIGNPETGAACDDDEDENFLGVSNTEQDGALDEVNDGCPEVLLDKTPAESGLNCENNIDDDADTVVNDGCPEQNLIGGIYFGCETDTTHNDMTNAITSRVYCYYDHPLWTNNPEAADDAITCQPFGPAPKSECGDGLSGSPPPAPFGDVDSSTAEKKTDCLNNTDDDVEPDGKVNDGCPAVKAGPGDSEAGADCGNATDDDADDAVNDGCPAVGIAEAGLECVNAIDDEEDGAADAVNDGCPQVANPETGAQCNNATDDDADTVINDGCPAVGVSSTVLTGAYDAHGDNHIHLNGCFQDVENTEVGPNMYWDLEINAHTGQGTVDIWLNQPNAVDCKAGITVGPPTYDDAPTASAEQAHTNPSPPAEVFDTNPLDNECGNGEDDDGDDIADDGCVSNLADHWDTDLDGCTNTQELGPVAALGGLRSPFNRWDLMDMWVNQARDRRVNIIDIGAIVNRFGATDLNGTAVPNRNSDPLVPPQALAGYDPSADRPPPLIGSNLWNLGAPDGQINIIEIGEAVAQFGHTCA